MESLLGVTRGSRLLLLEISLITTAILDTIRPTFFRQDFTSCNWKSCKKPPSQAALLSQQILTPARTQRATPITISTSKAARHQPQPTARLASATIQLLRCAHCACLVTHSSTELASPTLTAQIDSTIAMEPATQSVLAVEITIGSQEIASPAPTPITR